MNNNWKSCQLGDIITFQRGHDLPKAKMIEGQYPVVGSNGIIGYHNEYTTEAPSITVGRSGNTGKPFIVYGRTWSHNTSLYIKEFKGSDPIYVYYLLQTLDLNNYAGGSAVPTLNRNHIHVINVSIPPLAEQIEIGLTLKAMDDKIANNTKINHHLEQMAQAIFKSWFVDFEPFGGVMPDGWREGVISEIAESVYSGGTPNTGTTSFWGGHIPWLSSGETKSHFIIATEKTITQSGVDNSSTRLAHRFDVVMASAGQGLTRGQTSLLLFDSYVNQSVIVIHSDYPFFLFLNLSGRYEELRAISDSNSIRGSITTKMLAQFPMLLPSKTDLSEFSAIIEPLFSHIENNLRENAHLAELRDTLLPRLMSGELSIADIGEAK